MVDFLPRELASALGGAAQSLEPHYHLADTEPTYSNSQRSPRPPDQATMVASMSARLIRFQRPSQNAAAARTGQAPGSDIARGRPTSCSQPRSFVSPPT